MRYLSLFFYTISFVIRAITPSGYNVMPGHKAPASAVITKAALELPRWPERENHK